MLPPLFTTDPGVQDTLAAALLVVAAGSPLAGLVFTADGILIGAGDGRWLAGASVLTLLAYLPLVLAAGRIGEGGSAPFALTVVWIAFTGFMLVRWGTLWWRLRGDGWLVTGERR